MPEQTKIVASDAGIIAAEHWQGPLPPPATIEVYERLHPGAFARLLANFESESESRRNLERRELQDRIDDKEKFHRRASRAQWLAFVLTLVAFLVAGLSAYLGQTAIGVAAIGATILGIVKALLGEKK